MTYPYLQVVGAPECPTRDELQHAKLRADSRFWLAAKFNRDTYGEKREPQLQVSIGQLHIEALRRRSLDRGKLPPGKEVVYSVSDAGEAMEIDPQ